MTYLAHVKHIYISHVDQTRINTDIFAYNLM